MDQLETNMQEATSSLKKKGEEAEDFVSEGISKIRSKMATSGKTYPAPTIPETPSKAINDMLKAKCGKTFDNPVKYGIAAYICFVFTAIVKVYSMIYRESKPSNTMWMASCGVVSLGILIKSVLVYYIILACSFLLYHLLYYGCVLLALFGIGLGVAGAVFFNKDGSTKPQSPGFESPRSNKRE